MGERAGRSAVALHPTVLEVAVLLAGIGVFLGGTGLFLFGLERFAAPSPPAHPAPVAAGSETKGKAPLLRRPTAGPTSPGQHGAQRRIDAEATMLLTDLALAREVRVAIEDLRQGKMTPEELTERLRFLQAASSAPDFKKGVDAIIQRIELLKEAAAARETSAPAEGNSGGAQETQPGGQGGQR